METFGKYQVVELIGEGGFGRVYRAVDPALRRPVAIKTCTLRHDDMRERFTREAEIAANLRHPNILTVYDFGDHEGEPYLVQEYLSGEDLEAKIERAEPLALATKVEWLRQVADGLRYAHEKGVVHRDIKPANIRILPDDQVRIMDFGIAKLLQAERQLTQVGFSVGTTGYLAPEQLRGEEIDHRADIFSFGVVAYELVSYRRPFEADTITAVLYRIANEEPAPLVEAVPGCPPRLAACIERCLRKGREERWSSLALVIDELEQVAREIGAIPSAAARVGATSAFAVVTGDRSAATEPSAGAGRGDGGDAPARRRPSPAMAGLFVAALAVAVFGVLNVARWAESASTDESRTSQPAAAVPVDADGPAVPSQRSAAEDVDDPDGGSPSGAGVDAGTTDAPAAGAEASGGGEVPATVPPAGGPPSGAPAAPLQPSSILVLVSGGPGELEAETALIAELTRSGLSPIDDRASAAMQVQAASASEIQELGRRRGTGTVLAATLRAAAAPGVGRFVTGSATLNVRAYDANTGRLIGTENFEIGGRTPGKSAATENAAVSAAAEAVAYQASRWAARLLQNR